MSSNEEKNVQHANDSLADRNSELCMSSNVKPDPNVQPPKFQLSTEGYKEMSDLDKIIVEKAK